MTGRGNWQGMWAIVRFNWPFYLAAMAALFFSLAGLCLAAPGLFQWFCVIVSAAALYFIPGSLVVSHLVYDRSDLYRWCWLVRALSGAETKRMILCHSGFDEVSGVLRQRFPTSDWVVLDHFEEERMNEASIRRARLMCPPCAGTLRAPHNQWPVASASAGVIFGLLAIHELRSETERRAWFAEAARCLTPGGRIVVAEHVRDIANFLAFGPGALHFHSLGSWRRAWEDAGLHCRDRFRVTPWVRIFVIASEA
jgi:hypothetical protein